MEKTKKYRRPKSGVNDLCMSYRNGWQQLLLSLTGHHVSLASQLKSCLAIHESRVPSSGDCERGGASTQVGNAGEQQGLQHACGGIE